MPKPTPRPCRICGEEFSPALKHTVTVCTKNSCRAQSTRLAKGIQPRPPLIVDGRKRCPKCDTWKPIAAFASRNNRKTGIQSRCRDCLNAQSKAFQASRAGRHWNYASRYGVSIEWYEERFAEQDGKCALCRAPESQRLHLCVDHDHRTGDPRGLLCWICNAALGKFKDDPDLLRRAAAYVEADRAESSP